MPYSFISIKRKTDIYKAVLDNLKTRQGRMTAFHEIQALCDECHPSSPLLCVDLCEFWHIKQDFREFRRHLTNQPTLSTLLNILKNSRRRLILANLAKKPCSLHEIQRELKTQGCYHSKSTLQTCYIHPLITACFIQEEKTQYRITVLGQKIFNLFIQSDIAELPLHSNGYEERILKRLFTSSASRDELTAIAPKRILNRSLKRLRTHDFIDSTPQTGRVFYRATKRRATRKMTPTETRVFEILTLNALTVQDIGDKVGINVRRVYKYLRRLWLKTHVTKEIRGPAYKLTKKGQRLAQSLVIAENLTHMPRTENSRSGSI